VTITRIAAGTFARSLHLMLAAEAQKIAGRISDVAAYH
jgi:hypothetical protein